MAVPKRRKTRAWRRHKINILHNFIIKFNKSNKIDKKFFKTNLNELFLI